MNTHAHPWKLRLVHHGFSHVDLAWEGGQIHFNPLNPVKPDDLVVLISSLARSYTRGSNYAQNRQWCTIIAPKSMVDWLQSRWGGPERNYKLPFDKDGLSIDLEEYKPIPMLTPKEAVYKDGKRWNDHGVP